MMFSSVSPAKPHIEAGKLRALATWGEKRLEAMPDLPTFQELGYKDVQFYIWSGVFAPAGVPTPVMQTLRDAMRKVVEDPEFKAAMEKLQTPVTYLDAPEFQKFWDKDAAMLATAVQRVGKVEEK